MRIPSRIQSVTLRDFRAFPGGADPTVFNLGADGKNLLLFGENGAGKSSLFQSLGLLFSPTPPPRPFDDYRHVFSIHDGTNPGLVSVKLTSGSTVDYSWDAGNPHPATNANDASFQEAARRATFLDYKALLRTSLPHEADDCVNIFELVVNTLLREAEFPDGRTVAKAWAELLAYDPPQPPRDADETEDDYADILEEGPKPEQQKRSKAESFWKMFAGLLGRIVPRANRYLADHLQPSLTILLTPQPEQQEGTDPHRKLLLTAIYAGHPVAHPAQFLNEARLSAIALALYLAAVVETNPATTSVPALSGSALDSFTPLRLLVLDDPLLGLDLSHRRPLLDLLQTPDFSQWQVFLLTYDASWFEMASDALKAGDARSNRRWVGYRLHAKLHDNGWEMPVLSADEPFLDRAWGYLQGEDAPVGTDGAQPKSCDYKAAGVYLRSAFETILRDFCIARSLQVGLKENLRDYTSEDLWPLVQDYDVKNGNPLLDSGLTAEISMSRRYVLNPLCHSDPARPTREDIRRTHAALKRLKALLDQDLSWRTQLDSKLVQETKNIIGDNSARREKALKGLAPASEFALRSACQLLASASNPPPPEVAILLRSAFDRMLWRYCARKNLTFTRKCDEELSTRDLWDAANAGPAGMSAMQNDFVTAIEAHGDLFLDSAPTQETCAGKSQVDLESICALFAGRHWRTELHPKSAMDSF